VQNSKKEQHSGCPNFNARREETGHNPRLNPVQRGACPTVKRVIRRRIYTTHHASRVHKVAYTPPSMPPGYIGAYTTPSMPPGYYGRVYYTQHASRVPWKERYNTPSMPPGYIEQGVIHHQHASRVT